MAMEAEANTDGVSIQHLPELGGAAAVAKTSFKAGQQVFRERALVIAPSPTNLARVRAYCQLDDTPRRILRETFFSEAPAVRCAATAACEAVEATGDTATEVLALLEGEGWQLELPEVEAVIRVWNLNAYDNALAPVACKVSHSCAPNLSIRVDVSNGLIEGTACRSIAEGEPLGSWYIQDTGLWWMGADVRRTFLLQDRGFQCCCLRCCRPDRCRALPCDACGALGSVMPSGHGAATTIEAMGCATWHCEGCGREALGDALRSTAEVQLTQRLLLELKPARGVPKASAEELVALAADARGRLGDHHWTAAAAALILHFRCRAEGGLLTPFTVACGVRFLGWLMDRKLALPPAGIVRTPIAMAIDCIGWLSVAKALGGPRALQHRPEATEDLRALSARLCDFLLPIFHATGESVAHVARTGERVAILKEWLVQLQSTCGRCGKAQAVEASPAACGRCKQVRYCSRECQQVDWKDRHKAGCLPSAESLFGDVAFKLIARS
ncbi:unnamed protein product [Durusdinium trenchii]|uniref:Uncharacterized protein n=2 Tax=Durusdinium trenchii TaxID=1381693 RepID=A0ABP0Q4U5_9DINO